MMRSFWRVVQDTTVVLVQPWILQQVRPLFFLGLFGHCPIYVSPFVYFFYFDPAEQFRGRSETLPSVCHDLHTRTSALPCSGGRARQEARKGVQAMLNSLVIRDAIFAVRALRIDGSFDVSVVTCETIIYNLAEALIRDNRDFKWRLQTSPVSLGPHEWPKSECNRATLFLHDSKASSCLHVMSQCQTVE